MINKIPINLYYKDDGTIFNQGGKNKIPLLTKLSNFAYELKLVTPLKYDEYTMYAIFERADGSKTEPYPMEYYDIEIVKVGKNQERWYSYKTIIDDDVLLISKANFSNQLKIGFRAEFNTGEIDEETKENIIGSFNFVPVVAYCAYTLDPKDDGVEDTPFKVIVDYINRINAQKIDKKESIVLTEIEPDLVKEEGNAYYNLSYIYYFTKDTTNFKKGQFAEHVLDENGNSILKLIPVNEATYAEYDTTQKGSPTPRSIGERFGDVSNYLTLLDNKKVDKENGKGLSSNDFTDAYKNKVDNLEGNFDYKVEEAKTEVKSYTDTKIADLINGSPATLDTLKELADAYQSNLDIINGLIEVLSKKANANDVYTKTETDNALQNKVDKVNGKSLVKDTEIQKLSTVEHNANYYVLPSDVPHDSNYVHTDNNFTNADKTKLNALNNYDDTAIKQQITNAEANAKQYTNEQINELIGGASGNYDTLKELQQAFEENKDLIDNVNVLANKKVDKEDGKGLSTNDFTNEDKETLKYSAIPIYLKDYNNNNKNLIMGAINYTYNNGLTSKMFYYDGKQDYILLVVNRYSNYYEVIKLLYLTNEKTVYNIVSAPITDSSLITVSSSGQIVDTSGSGSVDLTEVKAYVDEELAKIVDNAPDALNTLKELATAYTEQGEVVEALNSAINNKVDQVKGKELSSNDYTDEDKEKVNTVLPIIEVAGTVGEVVLQVAKYYTENNITDTNYYFKLKDFGPGIFSTNNECKLYKITDIDGVPNFGSCSIDDYGKNKKYYVFSNNGGLFNKDSDLSIMDFSVTSIYSIPTKTSELENDAGFVTKNIIPNEINSKFAVSNSTTDLTDNMTTTKIYGESLIVRSMAYGNGIFVAVGSGATIEYSLDSGNSWLSADYVEASSSGSTFTGVAYGKGMFACCEYSNGSVGRVHKSVDGSNWEFVNEFDRNIENIIYANGRFILVGSSGLIAFSDDLVTFTYAETGIENNFNSITYGKNKYIAVSNNGDIVYSFDGITWYNSSIEGDTTHYRVASYGKGMFIIAGQSGIIRYSYDGLTWSNANAKTEFASINYIRDLIYYNGKFFACLYGENATDSSTDGEVLTSVDGINWVSDRIDTDCKLWAIAYGDEIVLIGGDQGVIYKYNLNIDWLDYEPVINKNEVLWQKQFLTLSDGSVVESEVEVHTNMKRINDEIVGKIDLEYPVEANMSLDNKTLVFNTDLDYPTDELLYDLAYGLGASKKVYYEDGSYDYFLLRLVFSISSSGIGRIYIRIEKNDSFYSTLDIYNSDDGWLITEFNFNTIEYMGYSINLFSESFNEYFKIVEKQQSIYENIINLKEKENIRPYILKTIREKQSEIKDYFQIALQHCYQYNKIGKQYMFLNGNPNLILAMTTSINESGEIYAINSYIYNYEINKYYSTYNLFIETKPDEMEIYERELLQTPTIIDITNEVDEVGENTSIESVLNHLVEYWGDSEIFTCKIRNEIYDGETILVNFSYNNEEGIEYANVYTSSGNKVYKANYVEGGIIWEEITKTQTTNPQIIEVEELPQPEWKGTPVPTSGYVEKVYFNKQLSSEEIENIIDSLTPNQDEEYYLFYTNSDDALYIWKTYNSIETLYGDVFLENGVWHGDFSFYEFNEEVTTNGLTIDQNDKISSLISITPFEVANFNIKDIYKCKNILYIWDNGWRALTVQNEEPQIINVSQEYTPDEDGIYNIDLSENGKYLIDMSGLEDGTFLNLNFGFCKGKNIGKLMNYTSENANIIYGYEIGFLDVSSYIIINSNKDAPLIYIEVEDYCFRIYNGGLII